MRTWLSILAITIAFASLLPDPADAGRRRRAPHESIGHQTWTSPQSEPLALSPDGSLLLVANTTSNEVDVIDTATQTVTKTIAVGMEPVSVAFKPDGSEAWVSNHVSDSVSVIDTQSASASFLEVVEVIQDVDANGVTRFDEPVGIAFADNTKAYVALSSRDQIAVVSATTYQVTGHLQLTAQEPRAITVRNGRLFVAAFESNNQSEISACALTFGTGIVGDQCSLGLVELLQFVNNPNLPVAVKNIVIDPDVPDRDLFVYRTSDDALLEAVTGVGTLLYGLVADSAGNLFVTQTESRNEVNGDHGTFLSDLDNRIFLNQIAELDCSGGDGNPCNNPTRHELEPLPPAQPAAGNELATPYGVALSADDSTLVVAASGTSRVFTWDTASGTVLGILDLNAGMPADFGHQIPKGVALASNGATGAPQTAYVLNTLENTVSVVDVSVPATPVHVAKITVGHDPTPTGVRMGNIALNNAFGSDSGTFSCGSCHPDGNTDQLIWRIGGACPALGCLPGDEPRTTMPVRGLRDTTPLHWTGSLGDPFGGMNGDIGSLGSATANCTTPHSCFRHLVDAALSGVNCDQVPSCAVGPSGLAGRLTTQEREDMATFLEMVSYPPARSRRVDDTLSDALSPVTLTDLQGGNATLVNALDGFQDFFMDQGGTGGGPLGDPSTCADSTAGCHEFPLTAGTNSSTLQGFDAPTMRGMTDRFLQFSMGLTVAEEILVQANAGLVFPPLVNAVGLEPAIAWVPADGLREITTFGAAFLVFEGVYGVRPLDIFQMFEEASTGHSGAIGRQVMLNSTTTAGCPACPAEPVIADLEAADANGVVNLLGSGRRGTVDVTLSYLSNTNLYKVGNATMSRAAMIAEAQTGFLLASLTAQLRSGVSEAGAQPLLSPIGAQCGTGMGATGDPALPTGQVFQIESAHVTTAHAVLLDGQSLSGATIALMGSSTACPLLTDGVVTPDLIQIDLGSAPGAGTHLVQVQSPAGLLSNEVPLP